ncbi:MAG: SLC13 family permease [Arcobacter sp.]|jgi:di/tricarboxylate transporter|uniref:SLC13 family permease n=1 Tax=Arcobacter sp. TaxID=1872629 RepID=UPI002A477142|nr:SLC13 family permease [Arcobacter sp.]MDX9815010.1 SLC13 family permease [Sulfurimonadaceae bacterium]MDY3204511.1 SLC13 family permease [Arcobacter sp.]
MKIFVAISLIILLILLIQNKYRASILFTGLASIYFLFDFLTFEKLVNSYTNNSLLTLILLLLVSIALEKTVLIEIFSKAVITKSYKSTFIKLGIITSIFSAFLNNTAVVASLMSIIKNNKYHLPSTLLLPLSYFAIFGGTMTLIGTSTNLLVNSFLIDNGHQSLKIFDFLYVGFFISLFSISILYLCRNFLPKNKNITDKIEEHIIEVKVLSKSSLISKSIKENGLRNLEYLFLIEINRNGKVLSPVSPNEIIEKDDKLLFSGNIKYLEVLKKFDGLKLVDNVDVKDLNLIDVIITPQSTLVGKKVKEANFRSKFDSAIISLKRGSLNISKIGDEILQSGDRLILSVGKDFNNRDNINKNFYVLSNIKQNEKLSMQKSIFVSLGFIISIVVSAFGFISLFKALLIFFIALLFFKTVTLDNIKRRFPYDIFMIIGSSLAISKVLISSGLANDLANIITNTFGQFGIFGSFVGIYLLTLILTEFITNNAAAALSFPIAYATAIGLDVNVLPFVFAVAFGASASFMIPYGYQTNLMVSSLGGYKMKDFIKVGWPVSLVYSLVVIIFVPLFFKF